MVQTKFGPDVGFSMRTFWFDAQTSSATGQNQTMECQIRLDPIAEVPSTQPDDCTCYTKVACSPEDSPTKDSPTSDSPATDSPATEKAVLMLSTYHSDNLPMVISQHWTGQYWTSK